MNWTLVDSLEQLQKGAVGTQLEVRRIERFQLFLALALAALVIATFDSRAHQPAQTGCGGAGGT
ncbi:MAG: hypothetical protein R2851_27620 [Caldilineaceae bacterium]